MKIELNLPHNEVPEHIISYVKDKLLELHRNDREISDAAVSFRKTLNGTGAVCICEVFIRMFGDTLLVHRSAENFSQAAREVVNEIVLKAEELKAMVKNPPDEILTTVKV